MTLRSAAVNVGPEKTGVSGIEPSLANLKTSAPPPVERMKSERRAGLIFETSMWFIA